MTRNPERISSAFAGIVMSRFSPVKTGMEKVYFKLSYIINYLYLKMKVSYLLVVAASKRMCGLVWTEGWE